jgi:hypothetical protein
MAWEIFELICDHMISRKSETSKPECGKLIQDCAFTRNRVRQDDVEGGKAIGRDKEKALAEVEHFADLPAAKFFYPGKFESGLHRDGLKR